MTSRLPPERLDLSRELDALRQRSGLSLTALAHSTSASRSSWHRYLRGVKIPPRDLVRELCALAQESPEPVLDLHERAETAGGRSGAAGGRPEPHEAASGPAPTRRSLRGLSALRRWWRPIAAGVLLGTAVAVGVTVAERVLDKAQQAASPPGCRSAGCTGKDPESQGCTHVEHEPVTVVERTLSGGARMDIRHSKGCAASWARVWLAEVGTRIEIVSPEGDVQEATIRDRYDAQGYVYTPMIGGMSEQDAEACYFAPSGGRPPEGAGTENPGPRPATTPAPAEPVAAADDRDDAQCFAAPR
ncbi:DUF2690 domain-containing protein [Streptomyces sp. 549]|uniref:helix-turn-helix domain-containing protein n=1 Tax=Streptomyces sp. 549 TaxID=3049076 RepID=UPI0024C409D4|nr:XRE family transcriptional regulator [Streptomyces sp. 549]MDK1473268.1 DUF2690 domain-containing protein [Streptomyces sp. 549]